MPRFVILEHRWNGVHLDVMLESGPALATWAVEQPMRRGVECDARRLPDHRMIYLEYEGPISGARGVVRRWAEGTFEIIEWTNSWIDVRIESIRLGEMIGQIPMGSLPQPTWGLTLRRKETGEVPGAEGAGSWSLWIGNRD